MVYFAMQIRFDISLILSKKEGWNEDVQPSRSLDLIGLRG